MRSLVVVAALAVASPVMAQTAGSRAADPAPIIAAERAFAADFPAMGLPGSFQKWSRPDAIVINRGRAWTVAELFAGAPLTRQEGEPLITWWPTFAGIARSGDMGFTTGPAAQDHEPYGAYFTVWRRQPDGRWLWVYDGGSAIGAEDEPGPDSTPRLLPTATVGSASPEVAWAEVKAAEAALAVAARTDQKAAHRAVLADDGRLYVAPRPPAEGPEAFAEALDGWPARFDFGPTEGGAASDAGDMAWTYGPAEWTQDGEARPGHYMRFWQKRPEGWRIVLAQLIVAPITAPPPTGG